MKNPLVFASCLLLPALALAAVPSDERMKGPFLIASTPYLEDGSVDFDALVAEAGYMDRSGCCGIIWPQSNDSIDLLTHEEKFTAIRRLVEAARTFKNAVLTIGVSGTNTAEMLEFAAFAEEVAAGSPAPIALAARPPTDGRTVEEVHAYFEALGKAAKRPVIVQSLVNESCPDPEAEFLIDLARRHPGVYGYIKEESDGQRALERQRTEVRAKPAVKTVFSAMSGWMWLYQARQCGTEGLVSERPAYAPLVARIWHEMKTGDRNGNLQALYAMYRYMIDQRAIPEGSVRGGRRGDRRGNQ